MSELFVHFRYDVRGAMEFIVIVILIVLCCILIITIIDVIVITRQIYSEEVIGKPFLPPPRNL